MPESVPKDDQILSGEEIDNTNAIEGTRIFKVIKASETLSLMDATNLLSP